jgi:predicted secreted hydrolase
MIKRPFVLLGLLAVILAAGAGVILLRREGGQPQARLIAAGEPPDGFERADGPRTFDFPADHGPHPAYQTEWWYYTGSLMAADGRAFGYQLTFFRRALVPVKDQTERPSDWAADQIYMAHFAITDVAGGEHRAFERFSRGAAELAGAEALPYRVWLENWQAEETAPGEYRLMAEVDDLSLELTLSEAKDPVLQGEDGYSRKGPEPGDASYYYSLTRLQSDGMVNVGGEVFEVSGLSWMDHEFSTSALSEGQVGWDWYSIQLGDGSEVMLYTIRREDGSVDTRSEGTYVAPDGETLHLNHVDGDYTVEVLDTWRSPASGAVYPARWRIQIPQTGLDITVEPVLAAQELVVSYAYWEGMVRIEGRSGEQDVTGSGYVELTGYAGSMAGQF